MGRHNHRFVFKVRSRRPGKRFNTRFVENSTQTHRDKVKGRILRISKVGIEEALGVREFNQLPKTLMKEFNEVQGTNYPVPV